ncbi:MAG: 4a-hydroxytetrahydrobiopterin dehydratase [Thermoflavifilum sp.]|nr:4a-hydroxytetrahydrobiopterin dehydratase [Thermoflavifilum sp.]MCL6515216.1 4a-hydroxytetrahydrobiopterin dehydratase [Alicyclobacillus sp.]
MKLEEAQIQQRLTELPDWQREDKFITRRYKFSTFPDAIRFVNRVADISEARNHHPFISIDYKFVTLRLTSWHAGGLTDDDFDEAKAFDAAYEEMTTSPK